MALFILLWDPELIPHVDKDVAISAVSIYQLSYKMKASRGFSVNTDSVIDSRLRFSFGEWPVLKEPRLT